MANHWFRMYHEMIDDPKTGTLSDAAFRSWVEILCVASKIGDENGEVLISSSDLNWYLRKNVSQDLDELSKKGLIGISGKKDNIKSLFICNWKDKYSCKRNRLPPHEWKAIRERIFARDDFTCSYCGKRGGNLECDHITPISKGGSNTDDNLTTSCFNCNRSKHAKTPEEWMKKQEINHE